MTLLESIKSISAIIKQYNDLELNQKIIDLTQQALDLLNENTRLTEENIELKKNKDLEDDIAYHKYPFVTRKSDTEPIKYCAACCASNKLVPMQPKDHGHYRCPLCKADITVDDENHYISEFM